MIRNPFDWQAKTQWHAAQSRQTADNAPPSNAYHHNHPSEEGDMETFLVFTTMNQS